ncbi:MAG: NFYB/HAP3 family transcription factor subunit [Candidatus Micrarchaeota archaeon]|nr:NFYB/HAP3 family transcription factor subunit [Candidatus Micrarchaeota archaeon]
MGERAFSLYDIEQFIREAGAERVTEDAVLDLEHELEKLTELLANRAIKYATHAGRKRLITKQDILLTRKPVYRSPDSLRPKARSTNATSTRDR